MIRIAHLLPTLEIGGRERTAVDLARGGRAFGIEALHPDEFIYHQFGLNNANVLIAAQRCRERLKNPPKSAEEYLDILERQGLPQSVGELRKYSAVI